MTAVVEKFSVGRVNNGKMSNYEIGASFIPKNSFISQDVPIIRNINCFLSGNPSVDESVVQCSGSVLFSNLMLSLY